MKWFVLMAPDMRTSNQVTPLKGVRGRKSNNSLQYFTRDGKSPLVIKLVGEINKLFKFAINIHEQSIIINNNIF